MSIVRRIVLTIVVAFVGAVVMSGAFAFLAHLGGGTHNWKEYFSFYFGFFRWLALLIGCVSFIVRLAVLRNRKSQTTSLL